MCISIVMTNALDNKYSTSMTTVSWSYCIGNNVIEASIVCGNGHFLDMFWESRVPCVQPARASDGRNVVLSFTVIAEITNLKHSTNEVLAIDEISVYASAKRRFESSAKYSNLWDVLATHSFWFSSKFKRHVFLHVTWQIIVPVYCK